MRAGAGDQAPVLDAGIEQLLDDRASKPPGGAGDE
jgi:hypothetical protein